MITAKDARTITTAKDAFKEEATKKWLEGECTNKIIEAANAGEFFVVVDPPLNVEGYNEAIFLEIRRAGYDVRQYLGGYLIEW